MCGLWHEFFSKKTGTLANKASEIKFYLIFRRIRKKNSNQITEISVDLPVVFALDRGK